ncbi:MAG: biopolymer transporter ExbD [Planctomycetota bacterium]
MQIPQHRSRQRDGINMTPMIDVVFLLIIFFLVSSHLARQESRMELELPNATSGQEDIDQETPRITVNVKVDGSMWIAGRTIKPANLKQTFDEVRAREGDGVEVRIRGSRMAPYATFEPIMLACTEAGIWNVTYAVYREVDR